MLSRCRGFLFAGGRSEIEMQRQLKLLIAITLAVAAVNAGRSATAGLISTGLDPVYGAAALSEAVDISSPGLSASEESAGVAESVAQDQTTHDRMPHLRPAALNFDTAGGMAPPSPESSGNARALAVETDATPCSFQQMSGW